METTVPYPDSHFYADMLVPFEAIGLLGVSFLVIEIWKGVGPGNIAEAIMGFLLGIVGLAGFIYFLIASRQARKLKPCEVERLSEDLQIA